MTLEQAKKIADRALKLETLNRWLRPLGIMFVVYLPDHDPYIRLTVMTRRAFFAMNDLRRRLEQNPSR